MQTKFPLSDLAYENLIKRLKQECTATVGIVQTNPEHQREWSAVALTAEELRKAAEILVLHAKAKSGEP